MHQVEKETEYANYVVLQLAVSAVLEETAPSGNSGLVTGLLSMCMIIICVCVCYRYGVCAANSGNTLLLKSYSFGSKPFALCRAASRYFTVGKCACVTQPFHLLSLLPPFLLLSFLYPPSK